jgi:hypothetical protein
MRLRTLTTVTTAICAGVFTIPASSHAQSPLRFGISAGMTATAQGGWNRGYASGVTAQLSIEMERVIGRLGLRADAGVFGFRRETFGGTLSSRTAIPGASANLVMPFRSSAAKIRPYLLAGGGGYRTEYGMPPEWHLGLSGGGGLRFALGRTDVFLESRLFQIADGSTPRLVPITLGFRF